MKSTKNAQLFNSQQWIMVLYHKSTYTTFLKLHNSSFHMKCMWDLSFIPLNPKHLQVNIKRSKPHSTKQFKGYQKKNDIPQVDTSIDNNIKKNTLSLTKSFEPSIHIIRRKIHAIEKNSIGGKWLLWPCYSKK